MREIVTLQIGGAGNAIGDSVGIPGDIGDVLSVQLFLVLARDFT